MGERATKVDKGPIEVGSRFDYRSAFMGREVDTEFETVAYEPKLTIGVTTDVPIEVRLTFHCKSSGKGTRIVQETVGDVGRFFGIAEPLIKPLMKRQFQKDLEALKHIAGAQ
jgi:hypothetical protein